MPDIDPDQIPTLEDVIDQDEITDDLSDKDVAAESVAKAGDTDPSPEGITRHDTEQSSTVYPQDQQTDISLRYQQHYNYMIQQSPDHADPGHEDAEHRDETSADEHSEEAPSPVSIDSHTLNEIIENTVKGLLPDLEQQLRFMIERSLREKLPAGLIELENDQNENPD